MENWKLALLLFTIIVAAAIIADACREPSNKPAESMANLTRRTRLDPTLGGIPVDFRSVTDHPPSIETRGITFTPGLTASRYLTDESVTAPYGDVPIDTRALQSDFHLHRYSKRKESFRAGSPGNATTNRRLQSRSNYAGETIIGA